jgi:N-methylhydantoinase A
MSRYSLGIDIGGTFTDVVAYEHESARGFSRKVLTTHDAPAQAVLEGIDEILRDDGLQAAQFQRVVHATTLFTNALIERRGAVTGLITTRGFRDVLEIGRERKYELYDLSIKKPESLIPRHLRVEVDERITAYGDVHTVLDEQQLLAAADSLIAQGVETIAIVFLHAYLDAQHEKRASEVLRARHPGLAITASHEVAPEIREFERASTAAANAYVKPLAARYLDSLATEIRARGVSCDLSLMISSGGLTHLAEAKRAPVQMLESGPAAGALAAAHFGAEDADGRLLAFDMGGTTAKLSLIDNAQPLIAYGFEAARQKRFVEHSGLPIRISTIELIEIGAGGGSIAQIDRLGLLKVGPHSAGSEPGPAAYGRGGVAATVTDADFILGYLNPHYFAGGTITIDQDACRNALEALVEPTGLEVEALAWGIHDVVNENMASAARVHIAERGRDPSDYTLLCTGGGGPVHAYYLAKKLRIRRVLCPPSAGVASALGLLVAPARVDRVSIIGFALNDGSLAELESSFVELTAQASAVLAEGGLDNGAAQITRTVDGRFVGQGFDLSVVLPPGSYYQNPGQNASQCTDQGAERSADAAMRESLRSAFESAYREKYQRTPLDVPIEFINARVSIQVPVEGAGTLAQTPPQGAKNPLKGNRTVYFHEAQSFVDTKVLDRALMPVGMRQKGPAVIEEEGSTLVVGPDATIEVLASGNVCIEIDADIDTEAGQ